MSADNFKEEKGKQETIKDILDGNSRDHIKKLKWGELRHLAYLLEKSYQVSKKAISTLRQSLEQEFKTVEELKKFIKDTLEKLDEENGQVHKQAEDKELAKEFIDESTNYVEKLEGENVSLSKEKEDLKNLLDRERLNYDMDKKAYQLYYDSTQNFETTLHGNEKETKETDSVLPKKNQQVQFKLDEAQTSPQRNFRTSLFSETKQLETPRYDFGNTTSTAFSTKANQSSTPYVPFGSRIESPTYFKTITQPSNIN